MKSHLWQSRKSYWLVAILGFTLLCINGCSLCCAQPPTAQLCFELGGMPIGSAAADLYYYATGDGAYQPSYCALPDQSLCELDYIAGSQAVCNPTELLWQTPDEPLLEALVTAVTDEFILREPFQPDLFWLDATVGYGQFADFALESCVETSWPEITERFQKRLRPLGFTTQNEQVSSRESLIRDDGIAFTTILAADEAETICRLYGHKWPAGLQEGGIEQPCDSYTITVHCAKQIK